MTLLRRFNLCAIVAVSAAVLAYCLAEGPGASILGWFAVPACVAGWYVGRGRLVLTEGVGGAVATMSVRRITAPRLLINFLVLVAVLRAAGMVMSKRTAPVSDLSEFLVYIQLIKLFDRRSDRDDAQVLGLSIFIVMGAILTGNSLAVGTLLAVYFPFVMIAAMLLHTAAGFELSVLNEDDAAVFRARSVRGRSARRHFAALAAQCVVGAAVLASFAFLVMPRGLGQDVLGRYGVVRSGPAIGFTDKVQLGGSGRAKEDTTPVMDVVVKDARGREMGDQLGALYLRGAVLNRYDASSGDWRLQDIDARRRTGDAPFMRAPMLAANTAHPIGEPPVGTERVGLVRMEVSIRNAAGQYLFSPWRPYQVTLSQDAKLKVWPDLGVMRMDDPLSVGRLHYSVDSVGDFRLEGAEPRRVEFRPGRVREFAEKTVRDRGFPALNEERTSFQKRQIAQVFQNILRSEYEYTLDMVRPEPGEDPIEMFLFRTRRGHCEYFASAMVALCQSVGVDARLVVGYVATEFGAASGRYTVRESNAHAWVEAEVEPGRWVRYDPTPPSELERRDQQVQGLMGRVRRLYEAMEFRWINSVVLFDEKKRLGLFGEHPFGFDEIGRRLTLLLEWVKSLTPDRAVPRGVLGWLSSAGIVGLVSAAAMGLWRLARWGGRTVASRWRSGQERDAELAKLLREAQFYGRMVELMEAEGMSRPAWQGPAAHAAAFGASASTVVAFYYKLRFGRERLTAEELREAENALQSFERSIAGRVPKL